MDDRQIHLELCALVNPGFQFGTPKMPWTPVQVNNKPGLTEREQWELLAYPPTQEYIESL